jgi:hypothetical protein
VQDENAKGKYPEHIQYVWTTPDGTVFSKDISNRLEKEYQLKLKGINSKLPAFIEEPTIILDEIVSIAKAPENLEELQEKAR